MDTVWIQKNNSFIPFKVAVDSKTLSKGIYNLDYNPLKGFYLSYISDKFISPKVCYNFEDQFIDRVLTFWETSERNVQGVCLTGTKGSGKSFTAKTISNKADCPVIILSQPILGFSNFIQEINQKCIVFIDEFEKVFKDQEKDDPAVVELLKILDGACDINFKILFILTTNTDYSISSYLLDRPGRIRYLKRYTGLTPENIKTILHDRLIDKSKIEEVVQVLLSFNNKTLDIILSFIDEINTFPNISPENLLKDFNGSHLPKRNLITINYFRDNSLKEIDYSKSLSIELTDKDINFFKFLSCDFDFTTLSRDYIDSFLIIKGIYRGSIKRVISSNELLIEEYPETRDFGVINDFNEEEAIKYIFSNYLESKELEHAIKHEDIDELAIKHLNNKVYCSYTFTSSKDYSYFLNL